MSGFVKLSSGILQSSVMAEDGDTFKVWIVLLVSADADGVARASALSLSAISGIGVDVVEAALNKFMQPDKYSRYKAFDGRRIEVVDDGYLILNYLRYRAYSHSLSPDAIRKREWREKNKPLWHTSFDEYQKEVGEQYYKLLEDKEWIKERETYHPRLNVLKTLEKAMTDFWYTEAGWKHKVASRGLRIDLRATLNKALSLKSNQVWKER